MKYCLRCVYPENHPLGIVIDDAGVCSGCRVHEEKDELDWRNRSALFQRIISDYRCSGGRKPDCVVPVSGAADSYYIVHILKNVYKMHPLLVTYNKQYNTPVGIRNLAYLRTLLGCDILTLTVSPATVRKVTRATLKKNGSIYWHCIAGQTVFPVQIAVRFKIPLIIWGAHQGVDQVGMFSHLDEVEMTRKYRKDHDLMGYEAEDLLNESVDLEEKEMRPFMYPHDKELESVGVRGIYLSNYIRWDSKKQHERMIELYGYETAIQHRTFDTYNYVDCFHYSDLHDYIKYLKWGYGKISDNVAREIRLKRLTRFEGIELVKKYQSIGCSRNNLLIFLDWLDMHESDFFSLIDRHRDPQIWKKNNLGDWDILDSVENHMNDDGVDDVSLNKAEDCSFLLTSSKLKNTQKDKYILVGRGWVDSSL